MDLTLSPRCLDLAARLDDFLERRVYPAERVYAEQRAAVGRGDHTLPPVVEELKPEARGLGLWNLFLPAISGLDNLDYAHLAELTGRSPYIPPRRSTAPPRTPATWSCSTSSAPRRRRSAGWSRCSPAASAPASR